MPVPLPVVLLVVTAGARLLGLLAVPALDSWPDAIRVGLAVLFLVTASGRLVPQVRSDLERMVPPGLPRPGLLVAITGLLEAVGALGLLVPSTARAAALCLGLLTVAMTPANVSAARRGVPFGGKPVTPIGRRLAEQALYIAACVVVAWLP